MGLDRISKVSLTFTEGGVGTLLPLLSRSLQEVRNPSTPASGSLAALAQQGALTAAAFVDPHDPSTIYVTQPIIPAAQPAPMNEFYATVVPVAEATPMPSGSYARASATGGDVAAEDAYKKRESSKR
jgi:hypothetical protein